MDDIELMRLAIAEAEAAEAAGEVPVGAIVVSSDGTVIGRGSNQVLHRNDPTAHAEVVAIRDACKHLGDYQLTDCDVYASCEPCPMCLRAMYWARPAEVYYANTRTHAAEAGFDDAFIYDEVGYHPERRSLRMTRLHLPEAVKHFEAWIASQIQVKY